MQSPGNSLSGTLLEAWEARYIRYLEQQYNSTDAAHDMGHFRRVWANARKINAGEGNIANNLVLLTAAYFHDFINLPKSHPNRSKASQICADRVQQILEQDFPDFPATLIPGVYHAVLTHSFSANITPETPEACILQDADRMEALGAIGLSRVFYTAGQMNADLFDPEDPLALNRTPDDKRFALDHFQVKLLQLPALMRTPTGKTRAAAEAAYLQAFLDKINKEISGT